MRTKQHSGALFFELHDALKRFFSERAIAHRQGFVNDQNIGVGAGGDGKSQAHVHAAGIGFNRLVNELAHTRKVNNAFIQSICLGTRKTHDCSGQGNIFSPREFGVKARTQFEQGANFAVHSHAAHAGVQGAAHHLQQG